MEQMAAHPERCVVTGSFGKAFGAAGGFMAGPSGFIDEALKTSVPDRFSCNLDMAGLGAVDAAMDVLERPGEIEELQAQLAKRLALFDGGLAAAGVKTAQMGSTIAFRVVPFAGAMEAIEAAAELLWDEGFLTTPVYYPTIARGKGAIRVSMSALHEVEDSQRLAAAIARYLGVAPAMKKAS